MRAYRPEYEEGEPDKAGQIDWKDFMSLWQGIGNKEPSMERRNGSSR